MFGRAGHLTLNAPISIPQNGHPCVFVGQKVLNRAAQIRERERETVRKNLDEGLELHLKLELHSEHQSHKVVRCAHHCEYYSLKMASETPL